MFPLLLLALGCPEAGTCTTEVLPVDLTEVTPLGMSAEEVLALVEGPRQAPLLYETFLDLEPTVLDLELTRDGGEIRFVRGVAEGELTCPSHLEMDLTWNLTSEDEALAEALPVTLWASSDQEAHLITELAADGLSGPWVDDAEPTTKIIVQGSWEKGEAGMGWIEHEAEYVIEAGEEDWIETELFAVAGWIEGAPMPGT